VGLSERKAGDIACKLEHILGDELLERLMELFDRSNAVCPHCLKPCCGQASAPPKAKKLSLPVTKEKTMQRKRVRK